MKKKVFSKIISMLLVGAMVLGMAACGGKEKPAPEKEEPKQETAEETKEETEEVAEKEREHVELVWYLFGSVQQGQEQTFAAVNEYLKEKLNTTIEFHFYQQSEFKDTVTTIFNSGTYMDLVVAGSSGIPFESNAGKNAFLALDDYIDEYLPGTKAQLPDAAWDAYSHNGSIYGVPPIKDLVTQLGIWVNQDMLDDLGVKFPEKYDTYYDLIDFFYEVKAARDAKYPDKADEPLLRNKDSAKPNFWMYYDAYLGGSTNPLVAANVPGLSGVAGMEDGKTVYCMTETDEYREYCRTMRKLVEDGIYPMDGKNFDPDATLLNTGGLLGGIVWGNIGKTEYPFASEMYYSANATLTTSGIKGNGYAIPSWSKNVERTLEVVELLNTDEYLATVIRFGPEGVGWTDENNDGVIEVTDVNSDPTVANRFWYQWYGIVLGSLAVTKAAPGCPTDFSEILMEMNERGTPSLTVGFSMDTTPVENEVAACTSVAAEYKDALDYGMVEDVDAYLDEYIAKLKASGIDKIVEECQKQRDAWLESQGK